MPRTYRINDNTFGSDWWQILRTDRNPHHMMNLQRVSRGKYEYSLRGKSLDARQADGLTVDYPNRVTNGEFTGNLKEAIAWCKKVMEIWDRD